MTSDTSSQAPQRHNPVALFKRSQYAIASTPDGELGCYGALLLKPMKLRAGGWREGEDLRPGTIVPGLIASAWPITNRLALKDAKYVRFFLSPDEAEQHGASKALVEQDPHRASVLMEAADAERKRQIAASKAASLAKARAAKAAKAMSKETV